MLGQMESSVREKHFVILGILLSSQLSGDAGAEPNVGMLHIILLSYRSIKCLIHTNCSFEVCLFPCRLCVFLGIEKCHQIRYNDCVCQNDY